MADEAGDASERFSRLFHSHYQDVLTYARRRVRPDDAQEIAAETFLIAWRRFDDLPDTPLPWLYRIASLEIANAARKHARRSRLLEERRQEPAARSLDAGSELLELTEAIARVLFGTE